MSLNNIATDETARAAEFRLRHRRYDEKLVTPGAVKDFETEGWTLFKSLKTGVKMRKERSPDQLLEDRSGAVFIG
jgi:hypothetical protein